MGEAARQHRADVGRRARVEQGEQILAGRPGGGREPNPAGGLVLGHDHRVLAQRRPDLLHGRTDRRGLEAVQPHGLDLPQRAEARLRVDLVLRQHDRRRPEALDHRAHERPDRRRGHDHRQLAAHRMTFERIP